MNLVCATANSLDDILTANLRLAEDRVISYLIILRSPSPTRSACPSSSPPPLPRRPVHPSPAPRVQP